MQSDPTHQILPKVTPCVSRRWKSRGQTPPSQKIERRGEACQLGVLLRNEMPPPTSEVRCRRSAHTKTSRNEHAYLEQSDKGEVTDKQRVKVSGLVSAAKCPTAWPPYDARRNPGQKKEKKKTSKGQHTNGVKRYLESQLFGWLLVLSDPDAPAPVGLEQLEHLTPTEQCSGGVETIQTNRRC